MRRTLYMACRVHLGNQKEHHLSNQQDSVEIIGTHMVYFSAIDRFFNRFRKRGLYLYAGIVVVATVYGCYALTNLPEVNEPRPEEDSDAKKTIKDNTTTKKEESSKDIKDPQHWSRKQLFLFLTSFDVIVPLEALREELLAKVVEIQGKNRGKIHNIEAIESRKAGRPKKVTKANIKTDLEGTGIRTETGNDAEAKNDAKIGLSSETKRDTKTDKNVETDSTLTNDVKNLGLQTAIPRNVDKLENNTSSKLHRPKPLTDVLNDRDQEKGSTTSDSTESIVNVANSANFASAASALNSYTSETDTIINVANAANVTHSTTSRSSKATANTPQVVLSTSVGALNRYDGSGHPSANVSPVQSSFVDNIDSIEKSSSTFADGESSSNTAGLDISDPSLVGTSITEGSSTIEVNKDVKGTDTVKEVNDESRSKTGLTEGKATSVSGSGRPKNESIKKSVAASKGTNRESTRESVKRKLLHFTPKRPLKKGESAPSEP